MKLSELKNEFFGPAAAGQIGMEDYVVQAARVEDDDELKKAAQAYIAAEDAFTIELDRCGVNPFVPIDLDNIPNS